MSDVAAEEGLGAEDWAGDMGRNWLANLTRFEGMIQPMGAAIIKHAAFVPGEHVIDIGCGGGATTIAIARNVSPGGSATGLDISQDLIDHCTVRGSQGTQSALYWVCADAAKTIPTNAPFDRMVSRFGCMFFPDAKAGFRNLRKMLKAGARADFAVWGPPQENGWISTIMSVIGQHVELPQADPHAPGPFAFAEKDYFSQVLAQAGFDEISFTPCVRDMAIGGPGATPAEAAQFLTTTMSFARAIEAAGPGKMAAVVADMEAALAKVHVPGKGNMLPGMAWLVTATAV